MEMIEKQIKVMVSARGGGDEQMQSVLEAANAAASEKGKLWDLTDEEYFGFPAVNNSSLPDIRRSPEHYYYNNVLGNKKYQSKAMDFGSLCHAALLQPDTIHEKFVNDQEFIEQVMEEKPDTKSPRATKIYKDLAKAAQAQGKTIVSDADFTGMNRIVDKVYSHPIAKNMLSAGHAEKTVFCEDPTTGLLLKAKMDFILGDGFIIDLKTTEDASMRPFQKSLWNYNYYVQSPFYLHVARNSMGPAFKNFLFLSVESSEPHGLSVYRADEGVLDAGERVFKRDLRLIAQCFNTNKWPGYSTGIQNIALPPWAFNQLEDIIDG